jgi:hypothetical protein
MFCSGPGECVSTTGVHCSPVITGRLSGSYFGPLCAMNGHYLNSNQSLKAMIDLDGFVLLAELGVSLLEICNMGVEYDRI